MRNSNEAKRPGCRRVSPDQRFLLEDHHPLDLLKLHRRIVGATSLQPVEVYTARLEWLPSYFVITRRSQTVFKCRQGGAEEIVDNDADVARNRKIVFNRGCRIEWVGIILMKGERRRD